MITDKKEVKDTLEQSALGAATGKRPAQAYAPLSEQLVIQHLKQCRDLTRGFAGRVFSGFWTRWSKQVLALADKAKSNKEQVELFEVRNLIAAVQEPAEQEFCQHLANGFVKFKHKTLNTLTGEERFSGDILSLVEHSDLEETIAITSIAHRAENLNAEPLWFLLQRLAFLNDGEKLYDRSNPTSPVQFCEALRKVLSSLEVDTKIKLIGYKIFDEEVVSQLKGLYEEINSYLIAQNFLPNVRFVPVSDSDSKGSTKSSVSNDPMEAHLTAESMEIDSVRRRASDQLLDGSLSRNDAQYQNTLLNAIRLLQTHITQQITQHGVVSADPLSSAPPIAAVNYAAAIAGNINGAAMRQALAPESLQVYSNQQIVGVLDTMQARAYTTTHQAFEGNNGGRLLTLVPQPVQDISKQMMQHIASENEHGAVEAGDMQTIDLVGMLFEYMLSDEHLPNSVKALLSYLHTPFLKIAFIDKNFFEQPEHPARVLLNSLAESGIRWVCNDGSDQFDIFTKIKVTVFRLLEEFKNDVRLFAELLIEFNSYTHNVARRQELMERRALEKAQGEEKLRDAKMQVNLAVRSRTDGRDVPSAVLLLLLQPWSDYLSFLLLRYGENSESWSRAVVAIDDLLWSLEPKTLQADKDLQMEKQSVLMATLEQGFETIGYEQAKGRKLLEAVLSLQKMALQSRKVEPASEPMRSKLENMAAEKAGGQPEEVVAPETLEEAKIVEGLKMIEFGTWFEFEDAKRLKVAWFNQKTNHYMMVDQQGRKVSLLSGLHLARDMMAGKARILEGNTKPFFERALESIYHTLSDRMCNLTPELANG